MPRKSRKDTQGTYFHVMCQGINKEYIFNDNYLKEQYRKILKNKSNENKVNIIAYCIMDNHVHLLLNTENTEEMSKFMKQVNTSYAMIYNKLKNRVGYVFRNRYLSKPINTVAQLQRCIVYIHKNPVVAKMVKNESEYKYSSYNEYLKSETEDCLICKNARNIVFGTDNIKSIIETYNYIHQYKNEELKEFDNFKDKETTATKYLLDKYKNLEDNEIIIKLNKNEKISERELANAFNKTRHEIRKILKNN